MHGFLLLALLKSGSLHTLKEVHFYDILPFSKGKYQGYRKGLDPSSRQDLILLLSEALLQLPNLQLLGHGTGDWFYKKCSEECADVELAALNPECWRCIDCPDVGYYFRRVR